MGTFSKTPIQGHFGSSMALVMAAATVLTLATALHAQDDPAVAAGTAEGYWEGTVSLPNGELPVQVDLEPGDEEGVWTGMIDIPVQGIRRLALTGVTVQDRAVMFKLPGIPGDPVFNGSLNSSGASIAGNYVHGQAFYPFILERKPEPESREDLEAIYGVFLAPGAPGESIEGSWRALMIAGPAKLRLVLNVFTAEDGVLTATLDSVDQGLTGLPISIFDFNDEERSLHFQMPRPVGAQYIGTLNEDGSRIVGQWKQGAVLALEWRRGG
jgi:hypothetical protein